MGLLPGYGRTPRAWPGRRQHFDLRRAIHPSPKVTLFFQGVGVRCHLWFLLVVPSLLMSALQMLSLAQITK